MQKYNLGIIGYGWVATAHIAAINATQQARVTAVYSSRKLDPADLSAKHGDELRDSLKNYIAHARKVGGGARRGARGARKPSSIDTVAVRAWARENGFDIKERGRVPAEVVAKYRQATGQ